MFRLEGRSWKLPINASKQVAVTPPNLWTRCTPPGEYLISTDIFPHSFPFLEVEDNSNTQKSRVISLRKLQLRTAVDECFFKQLHRCWKCPVDSRRDVPFSLRWYRAAPRICRVCGERPYGASANGPLYPMIRRPEEGDCPGRYKISWSVYRCQSECPQKFRSRACRSRYANADSPGDLAYALLYSD